MWFVLHAFNARGSPPAAVLPAHLLVLALAWAMGWVVARAWAVPAGRWLAAATARRTPAFASTAAPVAPKGTSA